MDQDSEEKQMQGGRRGSEPGVAAGWCDGFANGLDAVSPGSALVLRDLNRIAV
jgi:hypothetical protein